MLKGIKMPSTLYGFRTNSLGMKWWNFASYSCSHYVVGDFLISSSNIKSVILALKKLEISWHYLSTSCCRFLGLILSSLWQGLSSSWEVLRVHEPPGGRQHTVDAQAPINLRQSLVYIKVSGGIGAEATRRRTRDWYPVTIGSLNVT